MGLASRQNQKRNGAMAHESSQGDAPGRARSLTQIRGGVLEGGIVIWASLRAKGGNLKSRCPEEQSFGAGLGRRQAHKSPARS
jgi:hypothetical protein